ncbi:MAG: DUF3604 domain-containing protein [Steroidobacteraceae bacterium]
MNRAHRNTLVWSLGIGAAVLGLGVTLHPARSRAAAPEGAVSDAAARAQAREYSPPVRDAGMTNLYWGDTHLHTSNSIDAFDMGDRSISPVEAFRFARGEQLVSQTGVNVKLRRPLDFLVVADHAEYIGGFALAASGDAELLATPIGQQWARIIADGRNGDLLKTMTGGLQKQDSGLQNIPEPIRQRIWSTVAATADRFNEPGRFTAFSGYEWSSTPNSQNLHRIVMFRDSASTVSRTLPFSAMDSTDPEALWAYLESYERTTGGEVIAFAHNGNVSNGAMFAPVRRNGEALTAAYAATRARWEPVYEATQTKGDGETHPSLSPTDEFADFERWDKGDIVMSRPKEPWMLRYEYARSALREGLAHEAKLGVNPFKFGLIGSTDSHNGLSTTAEDNFFGKFPHDEPSPGRTGKKTDVVARQAWQLGASGLAAVWAPENTREAIFAAFKRREVYGTTGSRIKLRFFGGWDYGAEDVLRPDYAQIGYRKGVPMGGELMNAPKGGAPRFMVVAAKDPDEANLDRVQVIKGWLDAKGETHEKIYDVVLSDGRKVDPKTGKAPAVGSTVDVKNATYTNAIGDPELATVWTDPDFDATQRAFYYVRVIEIPKPRWTAYDAKFFNVSLPANIPMTVQDRAYSSPIWYEP